MRDDEERLKCLETCEVLVRSVLAFGMDHINKLKLKDLRVLLWYQFGSGKLKGIPKKLELVEAMKDFLESIGVILCRDGVGGVSGVTNEGVHEAGEDMGEISRFLF